jgi:ribosomal protein S18 acetylase RimI-like enzyme
VTLRPFAPEDIPAVRALWAGCEGLGDGPGDDDAGLARFLARNPGLSPVALEDSTIVGAALCGHDGRRGFLYRVAVAPTHRRRGVARALAERAYDGLRAAGIARAMVLVLADNAEAQAFWQAAGARRREKLELWSADL